MMLQLFFLATFFYYSQNYSLYSNSAVTVIFNCRFLIVGFTLLKIMQQPINFDNERIL